MPKYKITITDPDGEEPDYFEVVDSAQRVADADKKLKSAGWAIKNVEFVPEEKAEPATIEAAQSKEILPNPYAKDSSGAFWKGAKQGLTLGWGDEAPDLMMSERQDDIENQLAQEAAPFAYGAGEWIGGIPTSLLAGKAAAMAPGYMLKIPGLSQMAKAPSVARIAANPKAMGLAENIAEGAVAGAGVSEAGSRTEGAAIGAATAGIIGVLAGRLANSLGISNVKNANEIADQLNTLSASEREMFEKLAPAAQEQVLEQARLKHAQIPKDVSEDAVRKKFEQQYSVFGPGSRQAQVAIGTPQGPLPADVPYMSQAGSATKPIYKMGEGLTFEEMVQKEVQDKQLKNMRERKADKAVVESLFDKKNTSALQSLDIPKGDILNDKDAAKEIARNLKVDIDALDIPTEVKTSLKASLDSTENSAAGVEAVRNKIVKFLDKEKRINEDVKKIIKQQVEDEFTKVLNKVEVPIFDKTVGGIARPITNKIISKQYAMPQGDYLPSPKEVLESERITKEQELIRELARLRAEQQNGKK